MQELQNHFLEWNLFVKEKQNPSPSPSWQLIKKK